MKLIRLFIIAIIIVFIFLGIYFQLYLGEYVRYRRLKTIEERVCPLITTKNWCESLGCIADPIEVMPVPGKPGWFCKARNTF